MDYIDDDFIEEQMSSSINYLEIKNRLNKELKELKSSINNTQKIKEIIKNIEEILEWYW